MLKMRTMVTGERSVWGAAKSLLLAAIFMVTFACLAPQTLHAQYRASLRGTVTDSTGAVVPGATLTLTEKDTNETHVVTSNADGIFTFNALPSTSPFALTVERAGFKKREIAEVVLIPDQPNALNVTLEVGNVSQTVTVNGSQAALLDTDTATLSQTITSEQIQHLPSYNRDVFQLAQLAPGAFGDGSQGSSGGTNNLPGNQGPGGPGNGNAGIFATENGPQVQTRGGQYETNGITVDGISTVSAVWGGTTVITPSEDSIADVKVTTNNYDAENGRFSGASMEVTSKSGSNTVHGSAFIKASRPGLNAYQRWNGVGSDVAGTAAERGVNLDPTRSNNYGASLGGPLWKNRLFAFFNFESSPANALNTNQSWYETSQFDSTAATPGSIAATILAYPGESVAPGSTIVAQTCQNAGLIQGTNCAQYAGGLDVGSPIKTGLGMQDLTYGGNSGTPGVGGGLDGVPDMALFNTSTPSNTSQTQYNGRLDADATHNDHLSFAIYWVPQSTTSYNGPARAANFWHHSQINDAFSVIWNHIFSPSLINQARANAAGYRWNELSTNPQAPFGIPVGNIGCEGNNACPNYFGPPGPTNLNQWTFDYNDILTKTLGRQNIKAGGDWTRLYYLNNPLYVVDPTFQFENLWDFANDAPYAQSGQFNYQTGVPTDSRQDNRINIYGVFVQDDYKIRPNLTLNMGLRWSYFGGYYSKQGNLDSVQLGTGAATLSDLSIRIGGNLQNSQKSNFGPQFGFAWQPLESHNKLVVRGGFGINYNQNEIAILANGFSNLPNSYSANFQCPYPFNNNPTCSGYGIQYDLSSNVHSFFDYPANPAATTTLNSANLPTSGGTIGLVGFPKTAQTITTYHFSLDAQYQLPYDTVASVGYLGNQNRHLLVYDNLNTTAAQAGFAVNPRVQSLTYWNNDGTGNYNALVTSIKHNLAHNFNLEAQYTWAKAMDDDSGPYEQDPYSYDSHAAYGRSDYNVQNAFKLFGLWQPVFFHGTHGWEEKVFGEWSLSGIWNVHTGFPWNPVWNTSGIYYQGDIYQIRPSAYLGGAGNDHGNKSFQGSTSPNYAGGNGSLYYAGTPYILGPGFPTTAPGPTPGIRRNSLNGPGYNDVDASLTKGFGLPKNKVLGEGARLEFRADAYNLFNKTNINGGSINNAIGALNPDGSIQNINTNFGTANSGLGARVVQLQGRFSF